MEKLEVQQPGGKNMGRVQTSVMIDEDKRQLAKQRGLKLQDLLDEALNMALDLEVKGKAQLEIEKENILKEIVYKQKQKDEYLKSYNKEVERLEKQLKELEDKKDEMLAINQNAIDELNLKLQFNEKALAGAVEEQKEMEQQKERNALIQRGITAIDIDKQLERDMEEYCIKYNIADINQEIDTMTNEILKGIYGNNNDE